LHFYGNIRVHLCPSAVKFPAQFEQECYMAAKILDGKAIAQEFRAELKAKTAELKTRGIVPGLGVLLVGDDPASRSYVTAKEKACEETGLYSREIKLPATATHQEILDVVNAFNADDQIDGILVQLPLPDSSMEQSVIEAINPEKDVDGFHPINVGRMMLGLPAFLPCTPHGVLQILKRSGIKTSGAHVVVIGRSNIVGRPLVNLLSQKSELGDATVTMCHTRTKNMKKLTLQADIIVAAVGRPNTVTADMVKPGAVVIDVGVNRIEDASKKSGFRLAGDVDYTAVAEKASAITPVPGGVGPMTITMLLANTVESAVRRHGAK
jgi:methylenetetrahydrofolate dehydrogenase (NADP+)/methenyltetrahydrofolate cyclohydrolase